MLAARNAANRRFTSALRASAVVPLATIGVTPWVIDAGETSATSAMAGSTNATSRNCAIDAVRSACTKASALGLLNRTSSSVSTTMPAALVKRRVVVSNARAETGFGLPSPTQFTLEPEVCPDILMLNGTRRRPWILPMMVCGRSNSINSLAMV
ncbi:hypothetical protein D3C76_1276510 [compost metagenome]